MSVISNNNILEPEVMDASNHTTLGGRCQGPPGLKWACLEKGVPVSSALPFTGVSLVAFLIMLSLFKQYLLEEWLMQSIPLYRTTWKRLAYRDQRTLVNHHLSLSVKSLILAVSIVPFMIVVSGRQFNYSPIQHSQISVGDMLWIVSNLYTAMYAFELCYRTGISYIAFLHHTGTAIMAQYALVLTKPVQRNHGDGSIELILCLIWGLFDIVSEAIPHFTFIIYRLYPTRHSFLYKWFIAATMIMVVSTLLESAIVFWIYIALFKRWRIELKILTPTFHAIFTVAQLWGARALLGLAQRQKRLVAIERGEDCLRAVEKEEEASEGSAKVEGVDVQVIKGPEALGGV